jgi:hypothetical protein
MFTVEDRDSVQARLLARGEADGAITGAAFTGSLAPGDGDRWSDTDLVLAVRGELTPVLNRWTRWLYHELGALHHWDLPAGPRIIRVFLLPGWLEIDLTFAPEDQFGPRGPQWRTIFGQPQPLEPFPAPEPPSPS